MQAREQGGPGEAGETHIQQQVVDAMLGSFLCAANHSTDHGGKPVAGKLAEDPVRGLTASSLLQQRMSGKAGASSFICVGSVAC